MIKDEMEGGRETRKKIRWKNSENIERKRSKEEQTTGEGVNKEVYKINRKERKNEERKH